MELRRLLWRRGNLDKLAAHGVSQREVEELVAVNAWVVSGHAEYPDQLRVIGPTRAGRLLTVALAPTERPDVWRPITGWASTPAEVTYYSEESGAPR